MLLSGGNLSEKYPKSFGPKRSFIKLIPNAGQQQRKGKKQNLWQRVSMSNLELPIVKMSTELMA
jgi:hypothetical protein